MAVGNIQTRIGVNQFNTGNMPANQVRQRITPSVNQENTVSELRTNQIQTQNQNTDIGFRVESRLNEARSADNNVRNESRLNQPLVGRNLLDRQNRPQRTERQSVTGIRDENALLNTARNPLANNRLREGFVRQDTEINPVQSGINRSESAQINRIEQRIQSSSRQSIADRIAGQTLSAGIQIGSNLNIRT